MMVNAVDRQTGIGERAISLCVKMLDDECRIVGGSKVSFGSDDPGAAIVIFDDAAQILDAHPGTCRDSLAGIPLRLDRTRENNHQQERTVLLLRTSSS